jgi:glycosyltransferase involved in cell wall biosynthesis
MRIAIDARGAAEEPGGRGVMVRELLLALRRSSADHRYELLARSPWEQPLDERFHWRLTPQPDPLWNVRAGATAHRHADALLSMNSYLTCWFARVPSVMVVCDLVAFDDALMPQRRAKLIERATLPLAVRRATAITAISQATADDLIARFPAARDKTAVTLLAVDERYGRAEPPEQPPAKPYVLAVGTLEPRKNLPRLIEAFARLPQDLRDSHELVLVGGAGWETDATFASIERHAHFVRRLGHVPDADLPGLYAGAALFAYPSLYEGFGLPVLEAMAAGAPVLTSNLSSLPEVAGDAALYCDPRDVESIRLGLERGLREEALTAQLVQRGRERAAEFSWDRYATETLAAVERAAGGG